MANWGLLGGIGRGLNQFGDTLNRGLNADIQAKRQDEAEARRQASIEKRWARQDARQADRDKKADERYADTLAQQAESDKKAGKRYADTVARQDKNDAAQAEQRKIQNAQTNRRLQQGEDAKALSMYQSYEQEESKQISKIEAETVKAIREAQELGQTEEALRIKEQADTRIEQIQKQYGKAKEPYRNKLIQSGYLTEALPEPPPDNEDDNKPPPDNEGNGTTTRDDLYKKIITDTQPEKEPSILDSAVGGGNATHADPSYASGFARTVGGFYGNSARPVDDSDMSILESTSRNMGRTHPLAVGAGLMGDALEIGNDYLIQPTWKYLNTKPSQRN